MDQAQTLLGLHREDLTSTQLDSSDTGAIFFYSPRPGIASPGFQTLTRDSNYSWLGQGRLSREQAMQFTGSGEETIGLEGRLYPHMFGGLKTLDLLRKAAGEGARFLITRYYVQKDSGTQEDLDGSSGASYEYNAKPVGRFGIRRVRQGELRIGNTGMPDVLDFTLELVKLGDDSGDGTTNEFLWAARQAMQDPESGGSAT